MEQQALSIKQWTLACHLSAFAGFVFPFGNIFGPLVIWLMKKDEFSEIDAHGKEALNFQFSLSIYVIISLFLIIILIGFVLLGALLILQIVCIFLAAKKADQGELFRYPLSIKFIK